MPRYRFPRRRHDLLRIVRTFLELIAQRVDDRADVLVYDDLSIGRIVHALDLHERWWDRNGVCARTAELTDDDLRADVDEVLRELVAMARPSKPTPAPLGDARGDEGPVDDRRTHASAASAQRSTRPRLNAGQL